MIDLAFWKSCPGCANLKTPTKTGLTAGVQACHETPLECLGPERASIPLIADCEECASGLGGLHNKRIVRRASVLSFSLHMQHGVTREMLRARGMLTRRLRRPAL